jgi:hypothetical protein
MAFLWLQAHAWWTMPVVRPLAELAEKLILFRQRAWEAARPHYDLWEHEEYR